MKTFVPRRVGPWAAAYKLSPGQPGGVMLNVEPYGWALSGGTQRTGAGLIGWQFGRSYSWITSRRLVWPKRAR